MEAHPRAILAPGAKGLRGRLPLRQIMRHHAPGPATAQHLLDAIDDCTPRVLAGSPAGLFWRPERFQDLPLLIGHVGRRGQTLSGHGRLSSPSRSDTRRRNSSTPIIQLSKQPLECFSHERRAESSRYGLFLARSAPHPARSRRERGNKLLIVQSSPPPLYCRPCAACCFGGKPGTLCHVETPVCHGFERVHRMGRAWSLQWTSL
jgi:hypothetical protein